MHLSPAAVERIKNLGMTDKGRRSEFLISIGEDSASTHSLYIELTPTEYWLATSFPRERQYRTWWLSTHTNREYGENIRQLAAKYPNGLARLPELPEERSGEVNRATAPPDPDYMLVSAAKEDENSTGHGTKAKRGTSRANTPSIFPELAALTEAQP